MRAILLILLAGLLTSCLSATRERELYCLAATMTDVWQAEHELTLAEQGWRTAQQARSERAAPIRDVSALPVRVADVASRSVLPKNEEDTAPYQRIVAARARHVEAGKWYGLVGRRVQTRIEEDEMLYPVLGMLMTSTAIVLYPLVRWNVKSVLWDGTDPDAEDDPIQRFCSARLGQEKSDLQRSPSLIVPPR